MGGFLQMCQKDKFQTKDTGFLERYRLDIKILFPLDPAVLQPVKSHQLRPIYNNFKTSKEIDKFKAMEHHLYSQQSIKSIHSWQASDNFYYPFLNTYIFPLNVSKQEIDFAPSSNSVKVEPIQSNFATQNGCGLTEIDSPPLMKEEPSQNTSEEFTFKIIVKDRNILSNNTNLILSLIRRPSKSSKQVTKIIDKLNAEEGSEYTCKRFYSYQNYIKENVNDYRNKNAIQVIISHCDINCQIFSISEQLFYNQVCRILIQNYIRNNLLLDVLSLKKIKKTNRGDHLKVQRFLNKVLEGAKSFQECNMYKL